MLRVLIPRFTGSLTHPAYGIIPQGQGYAVHGVDDHYFCGRERLSDCGIRFVLHARPFAAKSVYLSVGPHVPRIQFPRSFKLSHDSLAEQGAVRVDRSFTALATRRTTGRFRLIAGYATLLSCRSIPRRAAACRAA